MIVDARGHRCPVPTLRLRRALETADQVTLLADDPLAKVDVPHLCAQLGAKLVSVEIDQSGEFKFLVRSAPAAIRR